MNRSTTRALLYGVLLLGLTVAIVAFANTPPRRSNAGAASFVSAPYQGDGRDAIRQGIFQRPTATFTVTPTNTITPTATNTPTNTPTNTSTPSRTPTATNTSPAPAPTSTNTTASQPVASSTPMPVATITPLLGGIAATATSTPMQGSTLPTTGASPLTWIAVGLVLVLILASARYLRQSAS